MNIITRKIQINVNESDKELQANYYEQLHKWRYITHQAANTISSHMFFMEKAKDMIYLSDEMKVKLADIGKDEDGMLNTSYQNSTYRVVSSLFKGNIPTDILSNLNSTISATFKKEKSQYFTGERSLRSYRNNIPIPFSAKSMRDLQIVDDYGNYGFMLFKTPIKTFFGQDRSNNKVIFDRIVSGEYQVKNSSIQFKKNFNGGKSSWFLLLTVALPEKQYTPIEGKEVICELSVDHPIIVRDGKKKHYIGNAEMFLYQRRQIQEKLKKLQTSLQFTVKGGKGRNLKMKAINRFKKKEVNYVTTKLHTYAHRLVNYAVKAEAEKIVLLNQKQKEEEAKENEFILRNWSYYDLIKKIEYKAKFYNIVVEKQ